MKTLFYFTDLVINSEATEDPSHTRNSSTTSQASVGYSSQNSQPGHSRQSSSGGESSHGRYVCLWYHTNIMLIISD